MDALDTFTVTHELHWYLPIVAALVATMAGFHGPPDIHLLDVFSGKSRSAQVWRRAGYRACTYDLKNDDRQDILSESGFMELVLLMFRLVEGALVLLGPPCSLFVYFSSSLHMRTDFRPEGNVGQPAVRMANAIVRNTVLFLSLLHVLRPDLRVVLEQPAQSFMFKMPCMAQLLREHRFVKTNTWMVFYGLLMWKPIHLLSNMPSCGDLGRTLTKAHKERLQKKMDRKKNKPVYYVVSRNAAGKKNVQGTKALATTAQYTLPFARALMKAWKRDSGY